uniref:Adenylate cyclase n=1 Tax=Palpitomonas bilix TaxID=652834 RepID=A0A7S3D7K0_9EUKA
MREYFTRWEGEEGGSTDMGMSMSGGGGGSLLPSPLSQPDSTSSQLKVVVSSSEIGEGGGRKNEEGSTQLTPAISVTSISVTPPHLAESGGSGRGGERREDRGGGEEEVVISITPSTLTSSLSEYGQGMSMSGSGGMTAVLRAKKKEKKGFDFSSLQLDELPPEILRCTSSIARMSSPLIFASSLNFSKNRITHLPADAFGGIKENLKKLNLAENRLRSLPNGLLAHLRNLEVLDTSCNYLLEFPRDVLLLTSIRELYLHQNFLTELPHTMARLTRIEALTLHENALYRLPIQICLEGVMPSLRHTTVTHNRFGFLSLCEDMRRRSAKDVMLYLGRIMLAKETSNLVLDDMSMENIPDEVLFLTESKREKDYFNPCLAEFVTSRRGGQKLDIHLPLETHRCLHPMSITRLSLANNRLSTLPESLTRFPHLKHLRLDGNRFTTVPSFIVRITTLEDLSLLQNRELEAIPPEVGGMARLEQIALDYTKNGEPPEEVIRRGSQQILKFFRRMWDGLHDTMVSLDGLGLRTVSSSVLKLSHITDLRLNDNELTSSGFGDNLAELHLEKLDVSDNCLESAPPVLCSIPSLTSLCFKHNQLDWLPPSFSSLRNLRILDLSQNRFATTPPVVLMLSTLHDLDISSNRIPELPIDMDKLVELQRMNVENNSLTFVSPRIGLIENLTELWLDGNPLLDPLLSIIAVEVDTSFSLYPPHQSSSQQQRRSASPSGFYIPPSPTSAVPSGQLAPNIGSKLNATRFSPPPSIARSPPSTSLEEDRNGRGEGSSGDGSERLSRGGVEGIYVGGSGGGSEGREVNGSGVVNILTLVDDERWRENVSRGSSDAPSSYRLPSVEEGEEGEGLSESEKKKKGGKTEAKKESENEGEMKVGGMEVERERRPSTVSIVVNADSERMKGDNVTRKGTTNTNAYAYSYMYENGSQSEQGRGGVDESGWKIMGGGQGGRREEEGMQGEDAELLRIVEGSEMEDMRMSDDSGSRRQSGSVKVGGGGGSSTRGPLLRQRERAMMEKGLAYIRRLARGASERLIDFHHYSLHTYPLETTRPPLADALLSLDLSHNKLSFIPADIKNLKAIDTLNLHHNQLESLPAEIGQCTTLIRLNLSKNLLEDLPLEFGHLDLIKVRNGNELEGAQAVRLLYTNINGVVDV